MMEQERPTVCTDCGAPFPEPPKGGGAAGYARTNDGCAICYYCAARLEMEEITRTGRMFCYVKMQTVEGSRPGENHVYSRVTLTTWPGHTITNIAHVGPRYHCGFGNSYRRSITATMPDGTYWYGTYYESAGDYARMKRCKTQR